MVVHKTAKKLGYSLKISIQKDGAEEIKFSKEALRGNEQALRCGDVLRR